MKPKYKGCVYIIQFYGYWNTYKIGYTRNLKKRYKALNNSSVLYPPKILNAFYTNYPHMLERAIHKRLADYRVNDNREFFKGKLVDIQKVCREEQHKINNKKI